ncbi:MAG: phosphate acyltransferase PlsX [Firmicutes bacterium]|nr:phosphate acyltransferase PlsX [Bacillota bacterium]
MKIAIDVMGGDHAPKEIVEGALLALKEDPSLELVLVGSEEAFDEYLPAGTERVETVISHSVMAMDESVENLRKKRDSSIYLANQVVKEGKADAIVSCGSTAAQLAAAILVLGRIKGVKRPAIVVPFPTLDGSRVMLDGGANVDVDAKIMTEFAVLGNAYARLLTGKDHPEVVLLSNGTEEHKGTAVVKETHQMLKNAPSLNFKGNMEAREIMKGEYDVLVTDGFTGNVVMKLTEGVASGLFKLVKKEITATTSRKIGAALVKPGLKNIAKMFDYNNYGGTPLLGVNGISVVCHGSSKSEAVKNAIFAAGEFIKQDFIGVLRDDIAAYHEANKEKEEVNENE